MGLNQGLRSIAEANLIIQFMALPGAYWRCVVAAADCWLWGFHRLTDCHGDHTHPHTPTHTGYILAVLLIDRIGRKHLQLFGFAGEAVIFGYMAVNQQQLKRTPVAFVFMYGKYEDQRCC